MDRRASSPTERQKQKLAAAQRYNDAAGRPSNGPDALEARSCLSGGSGGVDAGMHLREKIKQKGRPQCTGRMKSVPQRKTTWRCDLFRGASEQFWTPPKETPYDIPLPFLNMVQAFIQGLESIWGSGGGLFNASASPKLVSRSRTANHRRAKRVKATGLALGLSPRPIN